MITKHFESPLITKEKKIKKKKDTTLKSNKNRKIRIKSLIVRPNFDVPEYLLFNKLSK